MTAQLVALAFRAKAPNQLAQFWAHALRWNIRQTDGVVDLIPTDATSFCIRFQSAPDEKVGQNRIHFDLTTASLDDQTTTVAELLRIGSTPIDIGQNPDDAHVVLADPEGNEFCIIDPDNRFLSGCPRLGAVNCDGTHALGRFWSEVLGWPLVWDHDEETAIQSPDGTGPKITWSGPPLMARPHKERVHFHIAPTTRATVSSLPDYLLALGATRLDIDQACPGAIALADVDGNEFCLVER